MTTSWRRHITATTLTQHTVTQQIIQGKCGKIQTSQASVQRLPGLSHHNGLDVLHAAVDWTLALLIAL